MAKPCSVTDVISYLQQQPSPPQLSAHHGNGIISYHGVAQVVHNSRTTAHLLFRSQDLGISEKVLYQFVSRGNHLNLEELSNHLRLLSFG